MKSEQFSLKFKTYITKHKSIFGANCIVIIKKQIEKIGGYKVRLLCKVNDNEPFPCAIMPTGDDSGYIMLSKEKYKKLKLNDEDEFKIELTKDVSEFGMPLPEELAEILNQDPEGRKRFVALSPGKQRNIIYYTSKIKNSQLRLERAWQFISNLKNEPKGKERVPYILGLK
jgi:hypothetical protein